MSAASTPGPWRVGSKYPADIYAARAGHAIARAVNAQYEGECEANAHLIAAAPELLEACISMLAYDATDACDGVAMMLAYNDAITAVKTAIAKATEGAA